MRAAAGVATTAGSAVLIFGLSNRTAPCGRQRSHEQNGRRTLRSAAVGIAVRLRPGYGWRRGVILQTSGLVLYFAGTGRTGRRMPILLLLATWDTGCGIWTGMALRREQAAGG